MTALSKERGHCNYLTLFQCAKKKQYESNVLILLLLPSTSLYIIVDEEYDITVASFGLGTGKQTRIESDCGNF